jgi:hypothetical protein
VSAPAFSWAGWYVGVSVGYAMHHSSQTDVGFWSYGSTWDGWSDGVAVGGHIGFNWQYGSFVYGLEVAGAGIEYAPVSWPSWSIRSEFLYASLRRNKTQILCCENFGGTSETDFGWRFNDSVYIARLALLYRWGGGYGGGY